MTQDRISLDQIRGNTEYDLINTYDIYSDDHADSPFTEVNKACDYFDPDQFNEMSSQLKNKSSYFHLNCRGLSNNWESFKELLYELHSEQFSFDFIGISELWKCDGDCRLVLPGYHKLIARNRDDDNRGGVGLYIKDTINYHVRNDLSVFIPHVFESIFIEISDNSKSCQNKVIGVIYRPNTQPRADLDIFSSTLMDTIDIIESERKHCIIMGDFNINLLQYNNNDKTTNYVDNILAQGFVPLIHYPTRVTPTTATLIDHMYSNNMNKNSVSGIIITDVADHFGTFHLIDSKTAQQVDKCKEIRIHSEKNIEYFNQCLEHTDFRTVKHIASPDDAYNTFLKLYKCAYDKAFPIVKSKINKKYIKKEPWMTSGLLISSQTKSKLFKKKLTKPTQINIANYIMFRDKYNKTKKQMKHNYYHNILEANIHNMKKTWQTLKRVLGKLNDKSNFPQTFKINNMDVTDKTEISEGFNSYFSNIGNTTSQNVPLSNKHFSTFLNNRVVHSMFLEPVERNQVMDIVNKLKPKMSCGHDDIPTRMVKESIHNIIIPITHIINRSLLTGCVPKEMKIAKVIPIFKASDPTLLQNYRPVSLLPAFSKILEKIMFNKLMSFLNQHNILYKHQYGFRPKHATIHPLMHLLNKCAEADNSHPKEMTLAILCDLSKAFDVINHDILMQKLDFYGIRGDSEGLDPKLLDR